MQILKTKAEFDAAIAESGKLVVIDFFATWCPPCKAIAPFLEELALKYPDVVFVKVDVDENTETSQACGITAMPTFCFYKNGKKIDDLKGAAKEQLEAKVKKNK